MRHRGSLRQDDGRRTQRDAARHPGVSGRDIPRVRVLKLWHAAWILHGAAYPAYRTKRKPRVTARSARGYDLPQVVGGRNDMRKVRLSSNRSGWVEALIDGLNERRPWVAPGRPACQRATRALRCATALRDTARPSAQTAVMGLAARPGRGVPAVHTFAPSGQLASGRWLAYAVSFGGSGCKRRGLPGLIGVFHHDQRGGEPLASDHDTTTAVGCHAVER